AAALAASSREGPPALRLRDVRAARRALALAVRARGSSRAPCLVRGRDARCRRAGCSRVLDGMRIDPFIRNLAIIAVVALLIVVLNQETALATASTLVRFAFFIVIGVVAYFFWRDFGRREIETWPARASRVFYAAVALLVLDIGWYAIVGVS